MKKESKVDSLVAIDNRMTKMQECYNTSKIKVQKIKNTLLKADLTSLLAQMNNILTDYNKSRSVIKPEQKKRESFPSELSKINKVIDALKNKFGDDTINKIIGSCC